jgi:hypothetical protein
VNIAALGLLATFTGMTAAVLRQGKVEPRRSLSQHISSSSRAILYGKVGLTLGGFFFVCALVGYILPAYHLGAIFVVVVICAACLGTLTAYLPYGMSKRQDILHDLCSYGYVVLNPLILCLTYVALPGGTLRALYGVGIGVQIVLIALLVMVRPARRYFLVGQIVFLSVFALLLSVS